MNSIPEILEDLRQGRMIVLVDDESRENEGDLVCAAEFITPEIITFMLREACGMLCVPLSGSLCDELDLPPQSSFNTSSRQTAYTISVDAVDDFDITTGVSAGDRARTIRQLIAPDAKPQDFARPGHIHPLRARDGGVLVRSGQTEGSIDLCRLAGLRPGAVIIEVMNEDGTMARRSELEVLCQKYQLKMCSVADVIQCRLEREKLVERIDTTTLETEYGLFDLHVYRSAVDPMSHVVLTCGNVGKRDAFGESIQIDQPVLVRMHSQNLLGDVFRSEEQPTGKTLTHAMEMIQAQGCGALVYLRHETVGAGVMQKIQSLHLSLEHRGIDEYAQRIGNTQTTANILPAIDQGAYGIGCQILRDLGITKMKLATNHPFTPTALSAYDLEITEFVPV